MKVMSIIILSMFFIACGSSDKTLELQDQTPTEIHLYADESETEEIDITTLSEAEMQELVDGMHDHHLLDQHSRGYWHVHCSWINVGGRWYWACWWDY